VVVFEDEFRKSNGQPIQYKGKIVCLGDKILLKEKKQKIKVFFESIDSPWRQGIHLETDKKIEVNKQLIKKVALWYDTAPKIIECICYSKKGILWVWNIWDTGDGVTEACHNGAAMIVEELPNGRRYRCNDGYPDDDFDDLIFRIEIVKDVEG